MKLSKNPMVIKSGSHLRSVTLLLLNTVSLTIAYLKV